MRQILTRIILVVFLVGGAALSLAQGEEAKEGELPQTFASLRDLRTKLLREIPQIEDELSKTRSREGELGYLRSSLDGARLELDFSKNKRPPNPSEIARWEQRVKSLEDRESQIQKDIGDEIKKRELELSQKREKLAEVEDEINKMLNPELYRQKFKWAVSMVFASLVGVVIIGFFWIANRDDKVRQRIFSGQSGIQFVTLFSIVIAVILFGITGILEGKELAALLGGLSGYILGRVSSETTDQSNK